MNPLRRPSAVLFDLDGTLLDTAPDMVAALRRLLAEEGRPDLAYDTARCWVSNGVTGMLHVGFGALPEAERCLLGERFLALYAQNLTAGTQLFPDMAMVLSALEDAGVPWGVVTNKAARFTEPILAALGLSQRCACVVSGDTLPERKPSPAPLLHAAAQIPGGGAAAVYVGDAARDITAGRAAGMRTVAALYGYIPPGDDPQRWGADHAIGAPLDLVPLLLTATRRGLAAS